MRETCPRLHRQRADVRRAFGFHPGDREAYGAAGRGSYGSTGGEGGSVTAEIAVTPGETLMVYVGGAGGSPTPSARRPLPVRNVPGYPCVAGLAGFNGGGVAGPNPITPATEAEARPTCAREEARSPTASSWREAAAAAPPTMAFTTAVVAREVRRPVRAASTLPETHWWGRRYAERGRDGRSTRHVGSAGASGTLGAAAPAAPHRQHLWRRGRRRLLRRRWRGGDENAGGGGGGGFSYAEPAATASRWRRACRRRMVR